MCVCVCAGIFFPCCDRWLKEKVWVVIWFLVWIFCCDFAGVAGGDFLL